MTANRRVAIRPLDVKCPRFEVESIDVSEGMEFPATDQRWFIPAPTAVKLTLRGPQGEVSMRVGQLLQLPHVLHDALVKCHVNLRGPHTTRHDWFNLCASALPNTYYAKHNGETVRVEEATLISVRWAAEGVPSALLSVNGLPTRMTYEQMRDWKKFAQEMMVQHSLILEPVPGWAMRYWGTTR